MSAEKARLEAMKALAELRENNVMAERAIKGYIELLEMEISTLKQPKDRFGKLMNDFDDMEAQVKRRREQNRFE